MLTKQEYQSKINSLIQNASENVRERFDEDIQLIYTNHIESHESLLHAINDSSFSTRIREIACWLAARVGDEDSVPAFQTAANDKSAIIRRQALQALGELGVTSPKVLIILKHALFNDDDVEVRKTAAYSLGLLASEDSLNSLTEVLNNKNEDPTVRGMVAESLIGFRNPSTITLLIACLADEASEVRFWSAFALGQLGAVEALPELQRLASEDHAEISGWHSVSQEAADAIKAISDTG